MTECIEALVQGLVSCLLVCLHVSSPESLPSKSHIPIGKLVYGEVLDGTSCLGGIVAVHGSFYFQNQGLQLGKDPLIELCAFLYWDGFFGAIHKGIEVGIQGKEIVGILKCAKEAALHLSDSIDVEF